MNILLKHISEEEFEALFTFLAGYKQMGSPLDPDKALANKLFNQLIPYAKYMYGFEFEKIMKKFNELKEIVSGMNIIVEKKYPSNQRQS